MKGEFRRAAVSIGKVCALISDLRQKVRPSGYVNLVRNFRIYAPAQASRLLHKGPNQFKDLAWSTPNLEPVSLGDELAWAEAWLSNSTAAINRFREVVLKVEEGLRQGDIKGSLSILDEFIRLNGWSFWALELQCAVRANGSNADDFKAWSSSLLDSAPNSIPGLILHVILDRNDKSVSYDTFYARCVESFPRFGHLGDWLPRYLIGKSMVSFASDKDICAVLSRDVTSSLFDYYEAVVSCLESICTSKEYEAYRVNAISLISSLVNQGVQDHRLNKMKLALDGLIDEAGLPKPEPGSHVCVEELWGQHLEPQQLFSSVTSLVSSVHDLGVVSPSAGTLLKFATNYHGIDSASALGSFLQDAASDLVDWPCRSLGAAMASPYFSIQDIAGFTDVAARTAINHVAQGSYGQCSREICVRIKEVLEGASSENLHAETPLCLKIWTGRQLLLLGRFDEVVVLANSVSSESHYELRQAAKLKLSALAGAHRLLDAMTLLKDWVLDSPGNITEFPVKSVFKGVGWSAFRDFDPVLVATVTHHVAMATDSQSISYICRMACRNYFLSGQRGNLSADYERSDARRRALLISFLRDVWVEENLAMVHKLATTDAVRDERMSVLQLLLAWDCKNEHEYAQAIRDLTFVETIQSGLREINETRVFVNETGVARWAEKELSEDYDRWTLMASQPAQLEIAEGMLRQLLIDPSSEAFVNAMGNGRPTEADAALGSMVDRIMKKFLLDPADGLDAYLSLRIRHGTLRGTLFGPLEELSLFYATAGRSKAEFARKWLDDQGWDEQSRASVEDFMDRFSQNLKEIADELVNERVQIRSAIKPRGYFLLKAPLNLVPALKTALQSQHLSLASFSYLCCFMFWRNLESDLVAIREYVQIVVKQNIQACFDSVISDLRGLGSQAVPLVTALTAAATATQTQCDSIGAWFRLPGGTDGTQYKLSTAIEVARACAKNVHKTFSAEVEVEEMPVQDPALTTLALAVLSDALFVIFENVWKHSGLGDDVGSMTLTVRFDEDVPALSIVVRSHIADDTRLNLRAGGLGRLRDKYIVNSSIELASQEGGSGFAKLARLCRYTDKSKYPEPLSFGLQDDMWFTSVTIPMIRREAAYDALQ